MINKKKNLTFQISVDDTIFMKVDYPVGDLTSVITSNILRESTKIVQQLIQATTCIERKQSCDNHMTHCADHDYLKLHPPAIHSTNTLMCPSCCVAPRQRTTLGWLSLPSMVTSWVSRFSSSSCSFCVLRT